MLSLYLHFPFCETKCHYCDFYSIGAQRTRDSDPPLFERALSREIELKLEASQSSEPFETVFMGGGTPSMTPPQTMERLMAPLIQRMGLAPGYEWTMEANPSSVTAGSLRDYRSLGVNRVSMGVQALRDDLLLRLGRVHSRDRALTALAEIFEAGFKHVSVDLLCGVPGQSLKDLEAALQTLTRFPIDHLSCYLLTLPKTHKMFRELPDEKAQLEHLLFIDAFLVNQGFEHYEISNFAKAGGKARHNLNYWTGKSYWGLGPSAHGYDAKRGVRQKNISALHSYAKILLEENRLPVEWEETLTPQQIEIERWMLALRLREGFPMSWLTEVAQKARTERLLQEGLLERAELADTLRLTPRGFALSDSVVQTLLPSTSV